MNEEAIRLAREKHREREELANQLFDEADRRGAGPDDQAYAEADYILKEAAKMKILPKSCSVIVLQKNAYDLKAYENFSIWKQKFENIIRECNHLTRIEALKLAHQNNNVMHNAITAEIATANYEGTDLEFKYDLLIEALRKVQIGNMGSTKMQRNFETEKQPGDVDCVAWFQSKLALLRDVKMADDAYNDNVTNFLKYYTKSLNSTKTSRAVYNEMARIIFQADDRDSQLDEMQNRISTIAQRLANLSPDEEEADSSGKPKVGGITTRKANECPYCAGNTWDKAVQANAGNCPGKNEVYTGMGRDGREKLMSRNCPRLLNRQSNNQNGNSRGKGKFGNGNSGNNRNKGNGRFKGNCHECGQWGHRAYECPRKSSNNNHGNDRRGNNRGSGKRKVAVLQNQIKQLKKHNKKLKRRRNNNQGQGGGNGNNADNEDDNQSDSSVEDQE
jgi:hypothetical protein